MDAMAGCPHGKRFEQPGPATIGGKFNSWAFHFDHHG
jgi:hypothetical protein